TLTAAPPDELPATEEPDTSNLNLKLVTSHLNPRQDPLGVLAAAAGYSDGERWWEHMVEHRRDSEGALWALFGGILEAMSALRQAAPPDPDPREALREAWMRQTLRGALDEGFERIAVVCGASWAGA